MCIYPLKLIKVFGGYSEEVTPVPIPNTAVKLFSADGTAWATVWESRTPPDFFFNPKSLMTSGFFIPEFSMKIQVLRLETYDRTSLVDNWRLPGPTLMKKSSSLPILRKTGDGEGWHSTINTFS